MLFCVRPTPAAVPGKDNLTNALPLDGHQGWPLLWTHTDLFHSGGGGARGRGEGGGEGEGGARMSIVYSAAAFYIYYQNQPGPLLSPPSPDVPQWATSCALGCLKRNGTRLTCGRPGAMR